MICYLAHCTHWKWSCEAVVVLARDCKPHVANIDTLLSSVLLELLRLLHRLRHVIVHKLDQLVHNVLFVILDTY